MRIKVEQDFKNASRDYKDGYCEALKDVITLLDGEPSRNATKEIFEVLEEYDDR